MTNNVEFRLTEDTTDETGDTSLLLTCVGNLVCNAIPLTLNELAQLHALLEPLFGSRP